MRISDWSADVCSSDLEVGAVPILAIEVVTGLDEERQKALEVVNPQATVGLDQFVQRRRSGIDRVEIEEQLDLLIANLVTNHLFFVFTHRRAPARTVHGGGQFTPGRPRGSTRAYCAGLQVR